VEITSSAIEADIHGFITQVNQPKRLNGEGVRGAGQAVLVEENPMRKRGPRRQCVTVVRATAFRNNEDET